MTRDEVMARLEGLAETDYKEFNLRIIPTKMNLLGVRLPALRKLAKEIARGDWRQFLQAAQDDIYEEVMLQGLVIGYAKMDLAERLEYIGGFVPKIENWAICDSFCGTLKIIAKNQEITLEFLQPYLVAEEEFHRRFAVVVLMEYFIDDEYIDQVLRIYDEVKKEHYYVQMAVAWGISVCFVKYPQLTMAYLKDNNLDDFTYNKALQKIVESLRVDKDTKAIIRGMKRK